MNEYERIQLMNHQEHLLKENDIKYNAPWKKWLKAKKS